MNRILVTGIEAFGYTPINLAESVTRETLMIRSATTSYRPTGAWQCGASDRHPPLRTTFNAMRTAAVVANISDTGDTSCPIN